jgi:hypothetical protein
MSKNTSIADLINYISVDGSGNVVLSTGQLVATQNYVTTAVSNLVASAPSTLDTLNELATALGNDANFATTVATSIGTKLNLSGGTLTGALNGTSISLSSSLTNVSALYVRASSNSDLPFINFSNADGLYNWGRVGGLLQGDGDGALYFQTKLGGGLTEKMRITSGGNIGVGTISPTSKLHIVNNTDGFVGRFTGGASSNIISGIYANSTLGFASIGVQSSHQFRIFTNDADRLTVTSDGNIGINTTSPTHRLHILGTTGLPATSGTSQNGTLRLQLSGYGTVLDFGGEGPATGKQWIQVTDASNLAITYPLLLNPNGGSVGVGTTSPTDTKFQVNASGVNQTVSAVEIAISGSGTFQRGVRMLNAGMTTGESLLYMVGRNSAPKNTGQMYFYYDGNNSNNNRLSLGLYAVDDVFNITGSGLVGIGTTNPAGKLDISGGQYNTGLIVRTSSDNGTGLNLKNTDTNASGGHDWYIISTGSSNGGGAGNLGFYDGTNGNYLFYIKGSNGYAGIGTTNPAFKLDITSGVPDVLRVTNTGSATGNNPTAQFLNTHGNHSWGICAEFRVGASGGTDSSSIMFSQGYNSNTWAIGFGYNDTTNFRINRDQGPYGGGWGTTLFSMDRNGSYSFAGSNVSDRRNKKDINYIVNSQLDTILKLKPASFIKKSPGKEEYGTFIHTGFIAQDILEDEIPNLVHGNYTDGYALDYDGILAIAVKSIQELKAENDELREILNRNNII